MESPTLIQGLRIAFVFCLYFMSIACYLAPVLITKYWGSKTQLIVSPSRAIQRKLFAGRLISWCNCTAIGIFLALCFLVIIPITEEVFHSVFKRIGYEVRFPITECAVVCGFILTLLIEQSLISWREKRDINLQEDMEQNKCLLDECEMQNLSDDTFNLREQMLIAESPTDSTSNGKCSTESNPRTDEVSFSNKREHKNYHHEFSFIAHRESGFPILILSLATALHNIFEGVTLGLQTDATKAVHLFIAIIIHSCLLAVALGINSIHLRYSFFAYLKFAVIFSAAIPVGLLIGSLIKQTPGIVGEISSAVLQSISAGVLLHVAFQDFIPSEFSNNQDRLLKVLFLVIGFSVIAAITYFIN